MLGDDQRVSLGDELVEGLQQDHSVGMMETGGGLVHDVQCMPGLRTGQFGGEFDALGFTATEGR